MKPSKRLHLSIHQLIAYPGGRPLNCGEDGLPKTLTLGGIERTRISSQTAKRALRKANIIRTAVDGTEIDDSLADLGKAIGVEPSYRTRRLVEEVLLPAFEKDVIEDAADWAAAVTRSFGGADGEHGLEQPVVIGAGDIRRLIIAVRAVQEAGLKAEEAVARKKDKIVIHKKFAEATKAVSIQAQDAGLDGALFGRMATSEILDRSDATVRVGHAISTGVHHVEADFFSTVDDYSIGGPGAAHINNKPLTSALFYRHTSVDLGLLLSAFQSLSPEEVAGIAAWLVRALYRVGLTQRLAGDAAAQVPVEMIVDVTSQPPYSAALAFEHPVERRQEAISALLEELKTIDGAGGKPISRYRVQDYLEKPYAAVDALSDELAKDLLPRLAEAS